MLEHGGKERAEDTEGGKLAFEQLTGAVSGAAIEVHRALGPGLLESTHEACLCHELRIRGIPHNRQITLPVEYGAVRIDAGYRLDVLVEERLVVELKAVDVIHPIHEAQLMTYLRHSGCRVDLLINFNTRLLRDGIVRRVL